MNLQLKALRKRNGLRQEDLAKKINSTSRIVGAWERQETALPLEDAARIADVLDCSLDELAGRYDYIGAYSDERQRDLNSNFEELTDEGKDAALGSVRGIRASESARAKTEGSAAGEQRVG